MKIVLFGGTTEGRTLSQALLKQGHAVTVHVATKLGAEGLEDDPNLTVRVGRLAPEEILLALNACNLCVDATHPYALEVSRNIRWACEQQKTPLRRVLRPSEETKGLCVLKDSREAAAFLAKKDGNILLTTGAKELAFFSSLGGERLYARVLPAHESLAACEAAGIPRRNILAMWGPFSQKLNEAILWQYQIRWMVTKESGPAGGFLEKVRAAEETGVSVVVIGRPPEEGITQDDLLAELGKEGVQ